MTGSELDAVADELYGLPPAEFTGVRDEHAERAKTAGDADLAKAIRGLRRPTQAAWLVNLLSREEPELVADLHDLGARFAEAHRELSMERVRELSTDRTRLISRLSDRAGVLAEESGAKAGPAVLSEVEATLNAAVSDPEAAAQVRAGRLVKSLSYAGFEGFAMASFPPPAPSTSSERGTGAEEPVSDERRAQIERLESELADARESLQRAEETRTGLTERATRLRRDIEAAQRDLEVVQRELAAAEREISEKEAARSRAEAALRQLG